MIDSAWWSSLLLRDNYQEEHGNSTIISSFPCSPPAGQVITKNVTSVSAALRDLRICPLSSLKGWPLVDDKFKCLICISLDSPKLGSDSQFLLPYLRYLRRCACRRSDLESLVYHLPNHSP